MTWYEALLPFIYLILGVAVFAFGFLLVYRNLRKINLIEGEKFTVEDWLSCGGFGLMFAVVIVFAINLTFEIVSPGEIPSVAGYLLLVLLGILLVYPLWEAIFLGRPTSDAVHDFHRFLENKILDRFQGKGAYLASLGIFLVIYILPVILLAVFTPFAALEVGFMWFLLFPLFFLNYYAASGQVANIISTSYRFRVAKTLVPEKPSAFKKILGLVFMVIAWLPFILSIYNIYGPINTLVNGQPAPDAGNGSADGGGFEIPGLELPLGLTMTDLSAYLSLFTTVVFGIQGFFKRYWNKKSKTKTIDFIFSGYIFIGVGVNMLLNFATIDPAIVEQVMQVSLGTWQPLAPLAGIFENYVVLLPLMTVQSAIIISYGTYLLLNRKSDFHADLRLSAVNKAFGLSIDQLVVREAGETSEASATATTATTTASTGTTTAAKGPATPEASTRPETPETPKRKYKLPPLFKSVLLPPVYTKHGIDLNAPVRQKAAQFLFLVSVDARAFARTIVDVVAKHTIEHEALPLEVRAKYTYLSKEAVDLLGHIGKVFPDLVVTRLMAALDSANVQLAQYILDALGDVGEAKENLDVVLEHVEPLLVDRRYEVRLAAYTTLVEAVVEGEYDDEEFVTTILAPIYRVLSEHADDADVVDTALEALVKMCIKIQEFVTIDRILPFLDYTEGQTERVRGFILQNALVILGYIVYYNMTQFPVARVREFLDDERNYVRYVAVDAVGNYLLKAPDAALQAEVLGDLMHRALTDPDPDVTEMCVESVTEFLVMHREARGKVEGASLSPLEFFTRALDDANRQVAENASEALKSIAPLYQENIYPLLLDKIQGTNVELVRDCLHTIGALGAEIHAQVDLAELAALATHEDPSVRAEAAFALGGIATHRADVDETVLLGLLDDADPEVRLQAIFALGKLGVQKPAVVTPPLIRKFFTIYRESSTFVSEVELYAESLGIIGETHPSNEIIISLQQALMGDTNPLAKDVIAKALGRIGNGMIRSGNATRTIESEAFYNAVSWLQVSEKREYTIGNLVIIFVEALQQKGIPASVMDIVSDSIQDLLPVFTFRQTARAEKAERKGKDKDKDAILLAIKDLLAQAYYSNYEQEILETIDRCDSLLNFKRIFETDDPLVQEQFSFYAQQYTPDGKQFHDQGEVFLHLESQGPEYLQYALKSFEIAVELAPNEYYTPNCFLQMGLIRGKLGQADEARAALEEALELFAAVDEIEAMRETEEALKALR